MAENNQSLDKPITGLVGLSFVGAMLAFLTTSCCVLPMVFMLAGVGGAWLAVFSSIVAVSLYILPLAFICLGAAWVVTLRRGSSRQTFVLLAISSVLTVLAGLIFVFQGQISAYLISMM